jgi:hypothetical protein
MEAAWHEHQDQQLRRISDERIRIGDGKHFSSSGAFGNAIVVSMPGSELVRLYEKYGDILFDRNVRLFLGDRKGSVNAGIASTLRDEQRRDKFWAFNNGITMLCDGFEIEDEDNGLLVVRNFNIINGCQTTVSLARSTVDLTDVYVLARGGARRARDQERDARGDRGVRDCRTPRPTTEHSQETTMARA